jgi:hypothetical protein
MQLLTNNSSKKTHLNGRLYLRTAPYITYLIVCGCEIHQLFTENNDEYVKSPELPRMGIEMQSCQV